jgi:hypothetical protein
MAEPHFSSTADDDLPRTLRREKEARQREALGRSLDTPAYRAQETEEYGYPATAQPGNEHVTVSRFDVPFFRLMLFFIKAVFAAIPALILLGALLWLAGDLLMAYFPQLVKMQIIIKVPNP